MTTRHPSNGDDQPPSLTWGEPEWLDEPDPVLEALAALDKVNDRFVIVLPGESRD